MALAEKVLAQTFNATDSSGHVHTVVDHHTYVFAGDGCLMEGISHEACSLAGTWQLGKLIFLYDDNGISIDGEVKDWFTDDTPARFRAYGWQVIEAVDGHDSAAIEAAIAAAKANDSQPTLICCKTRIGFGSPNKEGTAASHGSPLGDDEIAATRQRLSWEPVRLRFQKPCTTLGMQSRKAQRKKALGMKRLLPTRRRCRVSRNLSVA